MISKIAEFGHLVLLGETVSLAELGRRMTLVGREEGREIGKMRGTISHKRGKWVIKIEN